MSSYTGNLNLYKADPVADGNDTFNIDTMMNENWDKIDAAQPFKATTSGTASALTVEGLPETDGGKAQLKLHIDIADGATLNGKPILTSAGEAIANGAKAGSYMELVYNASAASWYQIGGGAGKFLIDIPGTNKKGYLEYWESDGCVHVIEA